MRTNCDWFAQLAQRIWRAQPGRSVLVMVPTGCDEPEAAELVRKWLEVNFVLPSAYANHRPICIELVSESFQSSAQFARKISSKISRELNIEIEKDLDDYPVDILQNAIEAAISDGAYPILIIQRFHAFANIPDAGMTSILSQLRTSESDGTLTTLAFSPIGYDDIRRTMKESQQPFLNSVYGDMHEVAVMTTLRREDFLAEADARGIAAATAHRLYSLGGGPDVIFTKLLDLHSADRRTLVNQCADRAGPKIDSFLERAFSGHGEDEKLLANLALGQLNSVQEAALLSHPLSSFLCRRSGSNELICSSPVIAQRILCRDLPLSVQYRQCLQAVEAADYAGAAKLAASLTDSHPRLAAFRELVQLRGALSAAQVPERGLMGIDWPAAKEAIKRLRQLNLAPDIGFQPWLEVVDSCLRVVFPDSKGRRLQADEFTRHASDPQVRLLLLFMVEGVVCAANILTEPAAKVSLLVNVPEAILQSIAAGFCGIDFSSPPSPPPVAEYDAYFGRQENFNFPSEDQKLALSSLLVVVPTLLAQQQVKGALKLIDPDHVRPLQQKLVDLVRNPASHTIVSFAKKDAQFLEDLCYNWVAEWCRIEGLTSTNDLPIRNLAPDIGQFRALLFGDENLSTHSSG
jgi:hypothetical protein